jgi:hypothetical protein
MANSMGRQGQASDRLSSCDRLLDEHETAERLGLSVKTLRRWRWLKRGLPWVRVGAAVRYAPTDITAFIEANRQTIATPGRCEVT